MEQLEVLECLRRGEDSRQQFKRDVTNLNSLAAEMAAFANSKGGRLFIGVDDTGEITGLGPDDVRRLNQLVGNAASQGIRSAINPETENIVVGDKLVMVVFVPEGVVKPYMDNQGAVWVKSGADKRRVTSREELQRMFQSSDLVYADEVPIDGTTLKDLDLDSFRKFYRDQYETDLDEAGQPLGRLLENLRLAKDGRLDLAGLLLFGSTPQAAKPKLLVKAVSFVGDDPAGQSYRDSEDIRGRLPELYKHSMSFLTRNLRKVQKGRSVNTEGELEIPKTAMEELVVNMLLHRDFFVNAPWKVFIFDSRVELISPGHLPNNLTVENIKNGISSIRNPVLASLGTRLLPYRGIGTGIRRALKAFAEIEFVNDTEGNQFTCILKRPAADG